MSARTVSLDCPVSFALTMSLVHELSRLRWRCRYFTNCLVWAGDVVASRIVSSGLAMSLVHQLYYIESMHGPLQWTSSSSACTFAFLRKCVLEFALLCIIHLASSLFFLAVVGICYSFIFFFGLSSFYASFTCSPYV